MHNKKAHFLFLTLYSFLSSPLNASELDPLFSLSFEELMDVEITTAGKTPEKIKNIPASVVLISRSDIEEYGYTTLTDVLVNAPGLYNIYSYAGVSGNFGVRGFWNPNSQNSNIAFLVNGVRQIYDSDRSNPLEKINVPVESIDRIEIIRGPMAVLYGNGASFGVINIITNEVGDEKQQSLATYSSGSLGTKKTTFRLAAKENALKFVLNGGIYETDGLDNQFKDMMSSANAATLPSLGVTDPDYSSKNLLSQESKYFGLSGSYNNWIFDTAYNETEIGNFFLFPPLENGSKRTSRNTSTMLGYQTAISKMLDVDIRATYNSNVTTSLIEFLVPNVENTQSINYNSFELEFLSTLTPNDKISIITGINVRKVSDLREVTEAPAVGVVDGYFKKTDIKTQAIFAQATYQATNKLILVSGIRYEKQPTYKLNGVLDNGLSTQRTFGGTKGGFKSTTPRLAAIYSFDENNVIKFLYGEANRTAHDTLDAETTKTTEVNYIHSRNNYFSSLSLFQNQLQNLVINDLVLVNGSASSDQTNGGEVTTTGIELIVSGNLPSNLSGEFSITVQDSINKNNKNIDVGYSPKTIAHAKLAYKRKNSILSLLGRYVGAMEPLYDLTKSARVGERVGSYYVLDFNARQDNVYKNVYLNLKISNVFDEEIRYPNNTETNELLDRGTLGAERMFIGTIGVKF